MANLTIRDLDDNLKAKLRVRAAEHGHSMEAEVRAILASVLNRPKRGLGMGTLIHKRFSEVEDAWLELPPRTDFPRAAEFPE